MRLSRYFLPILRETPKEAEIVSHRLMLRAGMLRQQAAGIYSWLPLGQRVLSRIAQIVREEQDRADAAGARRAYDKMFVAYLRTFSRMGLTAIPMRAETGPIGGDLSHEFLVLADTGESAVYCDRRILDLPVPGADVDYEGDLRPLIEPWTKYYAATED